MYLRKRSKGTLIMKLYDTKSHCTKNAKQIKTESDTENKLMFTKQKKEISKGN